MSGRDPYEIEAEAIREANRGHGYVYERADGFKGPCGGPGSCRPCANDWAHRFGAAYPAKAEGRQ